MNPNKLRPIPKYIQKQIKKQDFLECPTQKGPVRFYAYLTTVQKELVKVTVAVKNYYKKWCCKQVAIHGVYDEKCYVKDMDYSSYLYMNYSVCWYEEGLQKYPKYYRHGWLSADYKYYDPYCTTVNKDYVKKFEQFKYSAHELYKGDCVVRYLRRYIKYPQLEYLMKVGLTGLCWSVTILKRIGKDKKFAKWLISHKNELTNKYYYIPSILKSYKTGKPLALCQHIETQKKELSKIEAPNIKELFHNDMERLLSYIEKHNINFSTYEDYLSACRYLELDMTLPKNLMPHDFHRWHDIRIDEYHTAKAIADEKERAEFYAKFKAIADKYLSLQHTRNDKYVAFIAQKPSDLVNEGNALHHCVGRMNYDQKFVKEQTLIFFIRNKAEPNVPFVTVEYSVAGKDVWQIRADHNTKPSEEVLHYVNNIWLPYANRKLKKIA